MSSILKALRRLEEEKARKSFVAPEIAANLLRSNVRRSAVPLWLWPALFMVGGAAMMTLFFLWLWPPLPAVQQTAGADSTPPPPVVVVKSGEQGGAVIIEEVIDRRRPVLLPPSQVTAPPSSPSQPKSSLPAQAAPIVGTEPTASRVEVRLSPLVAAIAWQEESLARMAVIDGLPVMTGETVGTARVKEIQSDRVLFTENGTTFAVLLPLQ